MIRVEEKHYESRHESKSPIRIQNHNEFDNNLDYLLEDLQNSISRSGATNDTESFTRISNLRPANPVTEFASDNSYYYGPSDGGKNVKTEKKEIYTYQTSGASQPKTEKKEIYTYQTSGASQPKTEKKEIYTYQSSGGSLPKTTEKKEIYSYQSSSRGGSLPRESSRIQSNINELDSLLGDLQQVKPTSESPKLKEGQNLREYSKSRVITGKTVVENVYPVERTVTDRNYVFDNRSQEESSTIENRYLQEGTYGNIKSRSTPTPPPSKTSTLSKQTTISNIHSYPMEVTETSTVGMTPEILANLDPNLLPSGNTKVTTTIKTYTYEIPGTPVYPGSSPAIQTERYVSPVSNQTTPSRSFVYNKYETDSATQNVNYASPPPPPSSSETQHYRVVETSTNTKTSTLPVLPPSSEKEIIRETVTSRNYQPGNVYPDNYGKQSYVYNESTVTKTSDSSSRKESPATEFPFGREPYHQKPPQSNRYPPQDVVHTVNIRNESYTNRDGGYPDRGPREPYVTSYNYSEKYSTDSRYGENQPLLSQPTRFPIENGDAPPKKLDDLMSTIGREPPNSPLNTGFTAHEIELQQQKKVEHLKQQNKEITVKDEQDRKLQQTKNVTGPPVYYPPGHEMFSSKSESSGGGWRAEGAMAKESGKYKYEAESSSKTKTKSGAAIVPVCLPLCCGLPCTIL